MCARRGYCTTALYDRYVPRVKLPYRTKLARFNSVLRSRGRFVKQLVSDVSADILEAIPLPSVYVPRNCLTYLFDVTNCEYY